MLTTLYEIKRCSIIASHTATVHQTLNEDDVFNYVGHHPGFTISKNNTVQSRHVKMCNN